MGNIINFQPHEKAPVEERLYCEIMDVLGKYAGEISVAAAVGILEIAKRDILQQTLA